MNNLDIRLMVAESGIKYKDIAKKIGISATYLSTLMRYELTPVMRDRIVRAIAELKDDKNRC